MNNIVRIQPLQYIHLLDLVGKFKLVNLAFGWCARCIGSGLCKVYLADR